MTQALLGVSFARVYPRLAGFDWRQKVYTLHVTCRSGAGLGCQGLVRDPRVIHSARSGEWQIASSD